MLVILRWGGRSCCCCLNMLQLCAPQVWTRRWREQEVVCVLGRKLGLHFASSFSRFSRLSSTTTAIETSTNGSCSNHSESMMATIALRACIKAKGMEWQGNECAIYNEMHSKLEAVECEWRKERERATSAFLFNSCITSRTSLSSTFLARRSSFIPSLPLRHAWSTSSSFTVLRIPFKYFQLIQPIWMKDTTKNGWVSEEKKLEMIENVEKEFPLKRWRKEKLAPPHFIFVHSRRHMFLVFVFIPFRL